jgi:recombination protein RecT
MAEESRALAPIEVLRGQLEARGPEYGRALPAGIKPERFQRIALTAVTLNPKLLQCSRGSLLTQIMKCAQDGLVPDGREAAIIPFKTKDGMVAQYIAMVAGVRKLVLQSPEVSVFEQRVVYAKERFVVRFGDKPGIQHKPVLKGERGEVVAAYSVATMANGFKSFEVMTLAEIEKVREVSRSKDKGPWVDWFEEMCRKTVAKRHAKMLPLSSERFLPSHEDSDLPQIEEDEPSQPRLTRLEQMDRLATGLDSEELQTITLEHDENDGKTN